MNNRSFCCDGGDFQLAESLGAQSATDSAPVLYFYHPDHLGSTAMVTDHEGRITQNVVYIPYGEVFVEERNGSWASSYLFNAKELDEETGLYYYGARYLDPTAAVWLSVDPKWENDPDKTPYNYCLKNPVKLVDPDVRLVWFAPVIEKAFEILIAGSLIVAYESYITKRNEDENNNGISHYHEGRGKNQNNQSAKSGQSSGSKSTSQSKSKDVKKKIAPNEGNAKKHGGDKHNDAIDKHIKEQKEDPQVSNIRKNKLK